MRLVWGMNMNFFDLHCDTVSRCYFKSIIGKKSILKNNFHIDLERGKSTFEKWVQTFAFWIDDKIRPERAYRSFLKQYEYFQKFSLPLYSGNFDLDFCAVLMVEGGLLIGKDIHKIDELKKRNIKILTLTWNHENDIASGALALGGLKPFGKQVVFELENQNIVVDVSHLNEESFWDVARVAKKPFIATHSNARKMCENVRNLKDDQINEIKNRKGIIGLNFYKLFLGKDSKDGIGALVRHIDHFLMLGCEDILAIGSDFDGADMPDDIKDITSVLDINRAICENFGDAIAGKIMFENARRFFEKTFI